MSRHAIYLETHTDGRTMAHVPALPGCISRAGSRDEALARLPAAVQAYHAWLRCHGDAPPPSDEGPEFEIAGETAGYGPFDPSNAAAIFPPDLTPVTPDEMERFFRLMGYTRADLLALVRDLPDEILDWQPDPGSFTLRRLLRHVGNAEEWYVSRIVPAGTLPPEWEHDEALPTLEFLSMERRTAVERLRGLTEAERSQVFYPQGWTDHPEEPWTARKMFRRFLEHEREHTAQARELLAAWWARLLAWLASERAGLLAQLTGLDERTLVSVPVLADWTAKDLLAHVSAWDEFFAESLGFVLAGREAEIVNPDIDTRNAGIHAERRNWPLERTLAALAAGRAGFLRAVAGITDEELHRKRQSPWCEDSLRVWAQWRAFHDAEHAGQLATWRKTLGEAAQETWHAQGPKSLLAASLRAHREALVAHIFLVPPAERDVRPICGEWTLRDVVGHLADWERLCLEILRQMMTGRPDEIDYDGNPHPWNAARAAARRGQPWETVWADFEAARRELCAVLDGIDDDDLNTPRPGRWGGTPYRWGYMCVDHDQEHLAGLRRVVGEIRPCVDFVGRRFFRPNQEDDMDNKLTSTTFEIYGYRITRQLGVVRGVTVRSRGLVGQFAAGLRSIGGGKIHEFVTMCEEARAEAFDLMMQHAQELGANAIVGIRYDATELGENMTEVLAYGTAVVVEPA